MEHDVSQVTRFRGKDVGNCKAEHQLTGALHVFPGASEREIELRDGQRGFLEQHFANVGQVYALPRSHEQGTADITL
ncbi:hypothetical protein [Paraburkholderia sp. CNPSo 3281]|uniref:hypothetical protein n=1 Tax=Paraburkholderia sp. CNPSo 3281 TaxID=2940933 RepID=UPI0020B79D20|nr:hypothetical protein [Paraburkholderia sp. CNPSo 3281]MCP3721321.1 hypothetical protein [Paraburkholderia sp. CNPSo 3281]